MQEQTQTEAKTCSLHCEMQKDQHSYRGSFLPAKESRDFFFSANFP